MVVVVVVVVVQQVVAVVRARIRARAADSRRLWVVSKRSMGTRKQRTFVGGSLSYAVV